MNEAYQIRASYNRDTIIMYQAYAETIAKPALANQRFVDPFSLKRMTWIKPSFSWLMHRSHWGKKSGQTHTLGVHINREAWEKALRLGVLTSPEKPPFRSGDEWEKAFRSAKVHVQWDTERSPRGAALNHYSIQVGLGAEIIGEFVDEWVVKIEDFTPTVAKLANFLWDGDSKNFNRHFPQERVYPVTDTEIRRRLLLS